ncbi:MAG: tetratricopeptide repeat protein, partial [Blastocatellia bacterium]|nr:tetratricopeptide repeat protein [Blastocatellia bacterium]
YRFIASVVERDYSTDQPALLEQALPANPSPQISGPRLSRKYIYAALIVAATLSIFLISSFIVRRTRETTESRRLLAVLPFTNISPDPEKEYFSDGLTEELITNLSQLNPQRLGVIARTSAMRYKETRKSAAEIGRELGVDYLVEGSIRSEDGRARITVQLVRVSDQSHLWAQSYDRPFEDVLKLQREVAEVVAHALSLQIIRPRTPEPTIDAAAREAYLKGQYQLNKRDPAATLQAIEFFRLAVNAAPNDGRAYVGLAEAYLQLGGSPGEAKEAVAKARESLGKALALDDTLAEAHRLSGNISLLNDWNWPLARREFERALELSPGHAMTHHGYATYLSTLGRHDEAIARMKKAIEMDPISPLVIGDLGWFYYAAGRYEEAAMQSLKALELEPNDFAAHDCLLHAYLMQGKTDEAVGQARTIMSLRGATPEEIEALSTGDDRERLKAFWNWQLNWLRDIAARYYVDPYYFALTYADLGATNQVIENLEAAYRDGSTLMPFVHTEPRYNHLRTNERFINLIQRIGPHTN